MRFMPFVISEIEMSSRISLISFISFVTLSRCSNGVGLFAAMTNEDKPGKVLWCEQLRKTLKTPFYPSTAPRSLGF